MSNGTTDWDAATYHRLAAPQEAWAREVLARLPLRGDEVVLDAGCGSGRTTALLLERLPEGRVIALDGSESMVAAARETLAPFGERVEVSQTDLLELDLAESVDLIFSNAVFHWISDHERLFERLRAALRPGGSLFAQCGGEGNVAEWQRAVAAASEHPEFAPHLEGWSGPWNFAGAEETEARLRSAGFADVRCWLEERVVEPEDPRQFVAVAGLAAHHERLPAELREPFTDAVLASLQGPPTLRYVRLNIEGRAAD
ncbi:MAG TPA: methyltransferase domain-containing protein [Solirubrobacterales bacterium]|nr:methyltransferase domain-containing protein [Solirubrobacterales bacterium]